MSSLRSPWELLWSLVSVRGLRVSAASALLALTACGGEATPAAESPPSKASSKAVTESPAKDDAEESAEPASAPQAACNDATCFSCGSNYCPTGWYCDESGSGGPACSWLPDCGKASSCSCIEKTLGKACSCKDDGGGPHVSCK